MKLIWAIALCFPTALAAQTANCDNDLTQSDKNACAAHEWQAADANLNRTYQRTIAAMKRIDANIAKAERGAEAALRRAQRA